MTLRILALLPWNLKPDRNAADRRFFTMLELLAKHYQVDVVSRWDERAGTYESTPEQIAEYQSRLSTIGVKMVGNGASEVMKVLSTRKYDVIFFELHGTAEQYQPICRKLQPQARMIIDTVDVHYLREESGAKIGLYDQAEVEKNKHKELSTYRDADAVIVITDADEIALRHAGGLPVLPLIPIIMPIHERPIMEREREVLFVGGFGHKPNIDGVLWFANEAWDRVREQVPHAKLTVVGSVPTAEVLALNDRPGITVEGFVPEVTPFLNRAAVSIAPLRFGGGMKGKVTEAMSHASPIVSTRFGSQGYRAENGVHMILADDPEEFALGVSALLKSPERAEAIGKAGQDLMAEFCTPEQVEKRLCELVASVTAEPARFKPKGTDRLYAAGFKVALPIGTALMPILKKLRGKPAV